MTIGLERLAYATDLEDFARFRGKTPAGPVAELLASREQGRRLALDFALELRRRGRVRATIRRRLSTLSLLAGMAGELGAVGWSLEIPSKEEVAAAEQAGQGNNAGDVVYYLPRHPTEPAEIDRLDLQHYALKEHLGGVGGPDRVPDGHRLSRRVHADGGPLRGEVRRLRRGIPAAGHCDAAGVGGTPYREPLHRGPGPEAGLTRWECPGGGLPPGEAGRSAPVDLVRRLTGSVVGGPVAWTRSAM